MAYCSPQSPTRLKETIINRLQRLATFLIISFVCSSGWSAPIHSPWPGGIAIIELDGESRPEVRLGEDPALVIRDGDAWIGVVGIPLDHADNEPLTISVARSDGTSEEISVDIDAANYRVQRLNVDRKYVEPDQESIDRIIAERKIIDQALTNWRPEELVDIGLQAPVPGARSTSFGSRRIFNDQPRSPHKGMDITANSGTDITAPRDGKVTATGDYYFNGNTVILDHGQGFVSLYCHLSAIDVEVGETVMTGTALGKVGATGRVTGAHLHFATYLNGTAVDPGLLLEDNGN